MTWKNSVQVYYMEFHKDQSCNLGTVLADGQMDMAKLTGAFQYSFLNVPKNITCTLKIRFSNKNSTPKTNAKCIIL